MTRRPLDLRLMLVTDPLMTERRGLDATVLAAVAGGVTIVQLRDKAAADEVLTEIARRLLARLRPLGIPLIVNDRVDVAEAARLDGVHLGQSDGNPAEARRRLGPRAIVGLSVTEASQAASVDARVVDYVGLGPVFSTATKPDATAPIGLAGLRAIRGLLPLPVVAIGGIDRTNARAVIEGGADGLAIVSAICAAADPRNAAADFFRAVAIPAREAAR